MSRMKIVLYFDLLSPFVYEAFYIIKTSSVFKDVEVTYVPVFLGGIMKACNNRPPLDVKNKGEYVDKQRLRWAQMFNIPMSKKMPPGFPANTLQAQRVLAALSLAAPEKMADVIAALWHVSFVEGKQVHKAEHVEPVVASLIGEALTKDVLDKAGSDEVKKLLSTNTEKVVKTGGFGLPWMLATNSKGNTDGFWGIDSLGQLASHLDLERPDSGSTTGGGWRAML